MAVNMFSNDGARTRGATDFDKGHLQTALAGLIGHDLRQYVQIILGSYNRLRLRTDDPKQSQWLAHGERAALALCGQLELLAAIFAGTQDNEPIELFATAVGPLLEQIQDEYRGAARAMGVTIKAMTTDAHVHSHSALLACVLRNLLSNAVKYSRPGGRVLIGARPMGKQIRIDVYDSGIGIAADKLPRLFEPYTRLAPLYGDGLGIGLSVVSRVADMLGHRIEGRTSAGKGSVFSIYTLRSTGG